MRKVRGHGEGGVKLTGTLTMSLVINQYVREIKMRWKIGTVARQGDVLIKRIKAVPQTTAKKRESGILAFGEVTGHCHKVEVLDQAEVLEVGTDLYLRVGEDGVRIVHDEHSPITLPAGDFQIIIKREYSPEAIRNVCD